MPYIDSDYYKNVFKGKQPADPNDLDKLIQKASDVVDMLTFHRLKFENINIETDIPDYTCELIKKATAEQVQYFVLENGYEEKFAGNDDLQSVSVGSFSYNKGSNDFSRNGRADIASEATIQYLIPTGLMYGGISV